MSIMLKTSLDTCNISSLIINSVTQFFCSSSNHHQLCACTQSAITLLDKKLPVASAKLIEQLSQHTWTLRPYTTSCGHKTQPYVTQTSPGYCQKTDNFHSICRRLMRQSWYIGSWRVRVVTCGALGLSNLSAQQQQPWLRLTSRVWRRVW